MIIGAPWFVTEDLLTSFNIRVVAEATPAFQESLLMPSTEDKYHLAKEKGIHTIVTLQNPITVDNIIERIMVNRERYLL